MAPCSVARYLYEQYFYRLCMLCYSHRTSPTPRIQASTQSCTLTRITVPAGPAEGQITSRSWEICERPQQHWKFVRQHCISQSIVDEGPLDYSPLLQPLNQKGANTLARFRQQPSPTLAAAPAMMLAAGSWGICRRQARAPSPVPRPRLEEESGKSASPIRALKPWARQRAVSANHVPR